MRLETEIYARKVMFIRTILCMDENSIYRRVMMARLQTFMTDPDTASENAHFSPLFDILRVAVMFGMMQMVVNMANNTHMYSKTCWKREVWTRAWKVENEEWSYTAALFSDTFYLRSTLRDTREQMVWWVISNSDPACIQMCENMASMICRASALKSDSVEFKGTLTSVRACEGCDSFSEENLEHIVMHCGKHSGVRKEITRIVKDFDNANQTGISNSKDLLLHILGKDIAGVDDKTKLEFWYLVGQLVNRIYEGIVLERRGVG